MTSKNRAHFSKQDIGGEILPILTIGLYRDTLDAVREYVQNSIDAGADHIEISIDPDTLSVVDNGKGMTFGEARKALRLGISDKNPMFNVGFRGIGIYSAFNLCDMLEVFTKSEADSNAYRIQFDFKLVRKELLAEQERRNQGIAPTLYLERLLEEAVFVEQTDEWALDGHGTTVILSGLLSEAYQRLNNWDQVVEYLQNTVPLPFSEGFKFAPMLEQKFESEGLRAVPVTLQVGSKREDLYRPYTDKIFARGGEHDPELLDIVEGKHKFGFAWICINDAREFIKDSKVRGLLIKKSGFSIGNRNYLEPYFTRTVFNRRITGEIIVQDPQLVPNAARSDFENNAARQAFLVTLSKFVAQVSQWANRIQQQDKAREMLTGASARLAQINSELPKLQRDREQLLRLNVELADIGRAIKSHVNTLKKTDPDGIAMCLQLLDGSKDFVREALLSQRRASQKLEREIEKAIQREALVLNQEEAERQSNIPTDLVALLEFYDLIGTDELRTAIGFLDNSILKAFLDESTYSSALASLRDYLEDSL